MTTVLVAATVGVLVTMALALFRAVLGPTTFDRILGVNMVGTKTVLLIAIVAFLTGRLDVLDLALVYALINFVGIIAVLRFTQVGHFDETGDDGDTP